MNLAILHYHLNRGGVTRVIENQLAALDDGARCGARPERPWRVRCCLAGAARDSMKTSPGGLPRCGSRCTRSRRLDYDGIDADGSPSQADAKTSESLYRQLSDTLGQLGFLPSDTVLHVHNHALGKNRGLLPALVRLAEAGYAMVLQIHDFVEDFRPANYRHIGPATASHLYPQAPAIHYGVLNGRDHGILREAGVPEDRLHLLPNPVPDGRRPTCRRRPTPGPNCANGSAWVATTGSCFIRCAASGARTSARRCSTRPWLRGDTWSGLTLPPLNPAEMPIYEGWKRLAAELRLPCRFELGVPRWA